MSNPQGRDRRSRSRSSSQPPPQQQQQQQQPPPPPPQTPPSQTTQNPHQSLVVRRGPSSQSGSSQVIHSTVQATDLTVPEVTYELPQVLDLQGRPWRLDNLLQNLQTISDLDHQERQFRELFRVVESTSHLVESSRCALKNFLDSTTFVQSLLQHRARQQGRAGLSDTQLRSEMQSYRNSYPGLDTHASAYEKKRARNRQVIQSILNLQWCTQNFLEHAFLPLSAGATALLEEFRRIWNARRRGETGFESASQKKDLKDRKDSGTQPRPLPFPSPLEFLRGVSTMMARRLAGWDNRSHLTHRYISASDIQAFFEAYDDPSRYGGPHTFRWSLSEHFRTSPSTDLSRQQAHWNNMLRQQQFQVDRYGVVRGQGQIPPVVEQSYQNNGVPHPTSGSITYTPSQPSATRQLFTLQPEIGTVTTIPGTPQTPRGRQLTQSPSPVIPPSSTETTSPSSRLHVRFPWLRSVQQVQPSDINQGFLRMSFSEIFRTRPSDDDLRRIHDENARAGLSNLDFSIFPRAFMDFLDRALAEAHQNRLDGHHDPRTAYNDLPLNDVIDAFTRVDRRSTSHQDRQPSDSQSQRSRPSPSSRTSDSGLNDDDDDNNGIGFDVGQRSRSGSQEVASSTHEQRQPLRSSTPHSRRSLSDSSMLSVLSRTPSLPPGRNDPSPSTPAVRRSSRVRDQPQPDYTQPKPLVRRRPKSDPTGQGDAKRQRADEAVSTLNDVIGNLHTMRISSPRAQAGPKPIANPIPNPSPLEDAVWSLVYAKTGYRATKQYTPPAQHHQDILAGHHYTATNMYDAFRRIATETRGNKDLVGLNTYLEGAIDAATLLQRGFATETTAMNTLLRYREQWNRTLQGNTMLGYFRGGYFEQQGGYMTLHDLESLMDHAGRDGWLNAEAIVGGIHATLLNAAQADPDLVNRVTIVHPETFEFDFAHIHPQPVPPTAASSAPPPVPPPARQTVVPRQIQWHFDQYRHNPQFVRSHLWLIPVHHHNHWALLVVMRDDDAGIHEVWHTDSTYNPRRQHHALALGQRLVNLRPDIFGTSSYNLNSNLVGPQQTNDSDCGVIVLQNAREAIFQGRPVVARDRDRPTIEARAEFATLINDMVMTNTVQPFAVGLRDPVQVAGRGTVTDPLHFTPSRSHQPAPRVSGQSTPRSHRSGSHTDDKGKDVDNSSKK